MRKFAAANRSLRSARQIPCTLCSRPLCWYFCWIGGANVHGEFRYSSTEKQLDKHSRWLDFRHLITRPFKGTLLIDRKPLMRLLFADLDRVANRGCFKAPSAAMLNAMRLRARRAARQHHCCQKVLDTFRRAARVSGFAKSSIPSVAKRPGLLSNG